MDVIQTVSVCQILNEHQIKNKLRFTQRTFSKCLSSVIQPLKCWTKGFLVESDTLLMEEKMETVLFQGWFWRIKSEMSENMLHDPETPELNLRNLPETSPDWIITSSCCVHWEHPSWDWEQTAMVIEKIFCLKCLILGTSRKCDTRVPTSQFNHFLCVNPFNKRSTNIHCHIRIVSYWSATETYQDQCF